tara:strand:+ start:246 stop:758 length:513 start_codon:yes stop_codon:yes gene_type:complete
LTLWFILIFAIITYYGIGLSLPKTITIAGSLKMNGGVPIVYETIKDFKNWKEWAIWNKDETLRIFLSEPTNEVGARYRWKSKIKELKDGLLILKETNENHQLYYEWRYGKNKRGNILFNIEELNNCSFVTCSITINNSKKIFARYFTWVIKNAINKNIKEVLLKIDNNKF